MNRKRSKQKYLYSDIGEIENNIPVSGCASIVN